MEKPIIAITLGDPAGIGPEVVVKSLCNPQLYDVCRPLVVGDKNVVENVLSLCDNVAAKVNVIEIPWQGAYQPNTIDLIDLQNVVMSKLEMGVVQAMCGQAAFDYLEKAVNLVNAKQVNAIANAPINKWAIQEAGIEQVGQTKILAALTQTTDLLTMLEVKGIRIFFLSRDVSLRQACDLVTQERVFNRIMRCIEAMKKLGLETGALAVATLNPHGGEKGLFGDEEIKFIEPAVREAQVRGYNVVGPINTDSLFHKALQGHYNAVLSLHHDQGYVVAKTLDFERTIAITNGLPFVRTSVTHGAALDIAGKGVASEIGMSEAIRIAAKYSSHL
ncbi:MAG: 4-hydroxythreonine-4-phosphate dehydrogenase PdxA [Thiomargarita sp.]|nr:4-hydroxythreonine-4-phosphate dehydrogenase PdxA [Thiomargarita sp.]